MAHLKSHYGATLIWNTAVKLAGFVGRLLTLDGKEDGVLVRIVEVVLPKGRVAYDISQFGEPLKGPAFVLRRLERRHERLSGHGNG